MYIIIDNDYILKHSILQINLDDTLFNKSVLDAQNINLREVLGTFYNTFFDQVKDKIDNNIDFPTSTLKVLNDIKIYTLFEALKQYLILNQYKTGNKGTLKFNDITGFGVNATELAELKDIIDIRCSQYKNILTTALYINGLISNKRRIDTGTSGGGLFISSRKKDECCNSSDSKPDTVFVTKEYVDNAILNAKELFFFPSVNGFPLEGKTETLYYSIIDNMLYVYDLVDGYKTLFSDTDSYTKEEINEMLSFYYTANQIDTFLNNYYTKNDIDTTLEDYYTANQIDNVLLNYYTTTQIATILSDYITHTELNNILTNYYTSTEVDSILEGYATQEMLSNAMEFLLAEIENNYYNMESIDLMFDDYYTVDEIENNYYNMESIDLMFDDYYTVDEIDDMFNNIDLDDYYTKTVIDSMFSNYYTIGDVDVLLAQYYYTKTETNTLLNNLSDVKVMTETQRLNLTGISTGKLVFQSDAGRGIYQYINSNWLFVGDKVTYKSISGNYTCVASDIGYHLLITSTNSITITIPSTLFIPGNSLMITQFGTGIATIVSSNTIIIPSYLSNITNGNGSWVNIKFVDSTTALMQGHLE